MKYIIQTIESVSLEYEVEAETEEEARELFFEGFGKLVNEDVFDSEYQEVMSVNKKVFH
tara:strand:- start:897 stop:1073 length:177 start_codon:yes stop_codon:yes gene_type:complete